jgi:hypothetical protein
LTDKLALDGTNRGDIPDYQIADSGAAADQTIYLKRVITNDCPVERIVEYQDPWDPEQWIEIREEPGRITFDFETDMSLTVAFDQEWYLKTHYQFYAYPADV